MIKLKVIDSNLFTKLYESFLVDDDPLSTEQDWRNVFDYAWDTDEGHCGYAMIRDDALIGMMGMVFSKRWIDQQWQPFCNLHTWWVREDQRGHSMMMLRPLKKLSQRYTMTHFTPCDRIRAVTKKLGFEDLNSQLRILLPQGRSTAISPSDDFELVFEPERIQTLLSESDRKLFVDHQPYGLGNLAVRFGDSICYVIYAHVMRHRFPYCHVHYIGERGLYAKFEPAIRAAITSRHRVRFLALDERLCDGIPLRRSFRFWAPSNALFRSAVVKPHQIDHLYSDVAFLKLTTLPDITHRLRQIVSNYIPTIRRPD